MTDPGPTTPTELKEVLGPPLGESRGYGKKTIHHDGKDWTIMELAEAHGMEYQILYQRYIRYGWSIEKCLTEPVRKMPPRTRV